MAGMILFGEGESAPSWYIGVHGFYPIVGRIRLAVPDDLKPLVEPLYEPIDQGFDFIAIDHEVGRETFNAFYQLAKQEYERSLKSETDALTLGMYFQGIMDGWADLIRLLEADERCLRD
jgi:hypothetical protein